MLSSRKRAERRARLQLHAFVDRVLAKTGAPPWVAKRAQALIEAKARVDGMRPMIDGSVVVRIVLPAATLRQVWDVAGVPWRR